MLTWLAQGALRTLTCQALQDWTIEQDPPWTPGYRKIVLERVQVVLADRVTSSGSDVRTRLLALIDSLIPHCRTYRTGTGPSSPETGSEGTVFLRDPETGEYLTEIDHGAVQGYLALVGKLTGVTVEKHQHQHLHAALKSGDLSEVPDSELIQAINAAEHHPQETQ